MIPQELMTANVQERMRELQRAALERDARDGERKRTARQANPAKGRISQLLLRFGISRVPDTASAQ